jgi:hypothetical protein
VNDQASVVATADHATSVTGSTANWRYDIFDASGPLPVTPMTSTRSERHRPVPSMPEGRGLARPIPWEKVALRDQPYWGDRCGVRRPTSTSSSWPRRRAWQPDGHLHGRSLRDFLFAALHRAEPAVVHVSYSASLRGPCLSAVNRCAPPGNRPSPEGDRCLRSSGGAGHFAQLSDRSGGGSFAWTGAPRQSPLRATPLRGRSRVVWKIRRPLPGPRMLHPASRTRSREAPPTMLDAPVAAASSRTSAVPPVAPTNVDRRPAP